ncbi:hypothetical protein ACQ4PT_036257 [Festuca glaucescens]
MLFLVPVPVPFSFRFRVLSFCFPLIRFLARPRPGLKGSLGAVVKLLPCDQEATGSSRGNSLLQKLQGKAAYNDPMWSDPSPDPAQSGSFMHRAAPSAWSFSAAFSIWWLMPFSRCSLQVLRVLPVAAPTGCGVVTSSPLYLVVSFRLLLRLFLCQASPGCITDQLVFYGSGRHMKALLATITSSQQLGPTSSRQASYMLLPCEPSLQRKKIIKITPICTGFCVPLLKLTVLHTVEFQKRGLPHAHILIWLKRSADTEMPISPLSKVNPGSRDWAVQVYVSRRWHHRGGTDDGPIKHTDLVLLDKEGNHMYGEIAACLVNDFMARIEEGKVYEFRRFLVGDKKNNYRPVEGQFIIRFGRYTTVYEIPDALMDYPLCTYALTPLDEKAIRSARNFHRCGWYCHWRFSDFSVPQC